MSEKRDKNVTASASRRLTNNRALFRLRTKLDDNEELTYGMIVEARKSGRLCLPSKGLTTAPSGIWTINDLTKEELEDLRLNTDFDDDRERWWEREPLRILDLSENRISKLDPEIKHLTELTEVKFSNNLLEELPPEISALNELRKLDLSRNKLGDIPDEFYKLIDLRHLNLSSNALIKISPFLSDLVMLEMLDLSRNDLSELPVGMGYLVRLVHLDISRNRLRELPPDLPGARALRTLNASFNNLEIVPPLGEMRRIETIVLRDNALSNFPDVNGCVVLHDLDLANNAITEIEMSSLEGAMQLKILRMEGNGVKNVPDDMIKLLNLQHLDLSCNQLTSVPNFIGTMPNLKFFGIDGNNVQNIRCDIVRCGSSRILGHLRRSFESSQTSTHDANESLRDWPNKYVLKNTKLLSLVQRNLIDIPDFVLDDAKSAMITCLDLSRNKLCAIPDKVSEIKTIVDLKLACNNLGSIEDRLGECLKNLRFIDLSQNLLTDLPMSLGNLVHLRELNISLNRFTIIPQCLYNVAGLEILTANDNQITSIDEVSLRNLQRLSTLDLSNNSINCVPPELGNHRHLRTLLLTGNRFKQPRHATLTKGTEDILSYLRDRIPA